MIQLGFPTAHRLTFLLSPPVTRTLPDLCPSARQFTFAPCATNSSANNIRKISLCTVKKDILNIFAILMSVKNVLKFRSVKSETFWSKDFCTCVLFYDMNILIISIGTTAYFNIW